MNIIKRYIVWIVVAIFVTAMIGYSITYTVRFTESAVGPSWISSAIRWRSPSCAWMIRRFMAAGESSGARLGSSTVASSS